MDESKIFEAVKAGMRRIVDDSGAISPEEVIEVAFHIVAAAVSILEEITGKDGALRVLSGMTVSILEEMAEPAGPMQ